VFRAPYAWGHSHGWEIGRLPHSPVRLGNLTGCNSLPGGVMRLRFELDMPDTLYSPSEFVSQVIESELAARRLPRVPLGSKGPRVIAAQQPHEDFDFPEPEGYKILL
jgi:hypothetical protein